MSTFRKSGVNDLKEKGWPPKCKRNRFFCTGLMPNRYKSVTKIYRLVERYLIIGEENLYCSKVFQPFLTLSYDSR